MAYSDKRIKEYLGHNGGECRVRIKRNGEIERYGSTDPFDRSKDYWALVGTRETVVREMIQHSQAAMHYLATGSIKR